MPKLAAIGELLIDFSPAGTSKNGNTLFERNPGGAPANVAVQAARLGVESAFLGKVGADDFGRFLKNTLDTCGVDTRGLVLDHHESTTLAFVQLNEQGDRSFSFYRNPGADTQLRPEEINEDVFSGCDLLHYGSLLFTTEPGRSTVYALLERAKKMGKILSYDPNWREPLWKDRETGLREMRAGVAYADILKLSEEELPLLTGETDLTRGLSALHAMGPAVIALTRGAQGCLISCREGTAACPTYDTPVIDTTGCGDSFFGAFLSQILLSGREISSLTLKDLTAFADYANASGSVCGTAKGAIPALPDDAAIRACIAQVSKLHI